MAQTSYPFDSATITENQYTEFFQEIASQGVCAAIGSSELQVSAPGGSMNLNIAAGDAIVRGHFFKSDSTAVVTPAVGGASIRTDIVVLRLNPALNSIVFAIVQGVGGGGPPALTQTTTGIYELPLAQITVPISATTLSSGNVADVRTFKGNDVGVWTTSTRPSTPRTGRTGWNTSIGSLEAYNGSTWGAVAGTLPAGALVGTTDAQTLTNKRITKRVLSMTSSGTPAINTDNYDAVTITALAANITSMSSSLTGTPTDFQPLVIRIKDSGTARTITWGSSFASRGATLPATTVIGKTTTVGVMWNAAASTWDCVAATTEA